MKKLFGFTLSELMVAFVILGVLCAVVMPIIFYDNPNKNKMMMKRAYYGFSEAISTLINEIGIDPTDENDEGYCYENKATGYVGFDCLNSVTTKELPYRFSRLFNLEKRIKATQMTTNSLSSLGGLCEAVDSTKACYSVNTSDKIVWVFPSNNNFTKDISSFILVGVDVNGDKAPNCYQGSTTDSCKNQTKNFDQLLIKLFADGGIQIAPKQCWAEIAISVSSSIADIDECTNEE